MIGKIEIKGLDELDEKLVLFDDKTKDKMLSRSLSVALTPMRRDAKAMAAVAPEPHTMTLRTGRKVEVMPGLLKSAIRKRKVPKREMGELGGHGVAMGIYVGKGTKQKEYPNYWHFIEYGTSQMPAVPFIRPAFNKNIEVAVNAFAKKLSEEIEKEIEQRSK